MEVRNHGSSAHQSYPLIDPRRISEIHFKRDMDSGLSLPWWEFTPAELAVPGFVVQRDTIAQKSDIVQIFLQAGARTETAERFISANNLEMSQVLETLGGDELVVPEVQEQGDGLCALTRKAEVNHTGSATLRCRSRLLGLPLADRHSVLRLACSLGHRLPRRALVEFLCRIVLGDGIPHVQHFRYRTAGSRGEGERDALCACGGQALGRQGQETIASVRTGYSSSPMSGPNAPCAACKLCLERREWLDSFSARLLTVACRKLTWAKCLPEDEKIALSRCLAALAGALSPPCPGPSWRESRLVIRENESNASSKSLVGASKSAKHAESAMSSKPQGGESTLLSSSSTTTQTRGVAAILEFATGGDLTRDVRGGNRHLDEDCLRRKKAASPSMKEPRPRGETEAGQHVDVNPGPARKRARSNYVLSDPLKRATACSPSKELEDAPASPASATTPMRDSDAPKSPTHDHPTAQEDGTAMVSQIDQVHAGDEGGKDQEQRSEAKKEDMEGDNCLTPEMRSQLRRIADRVVSASARGSTSMDVQGVASEVVSLLETSVSPSFHRQRRPQEALPLEVVCRVLGLDKPRGSEGGKGCGDEFVLAVCKGFVTPALSLRNCLVFVSAVLVPRARSLTSPASRLLVTAMSDIGKARPEAIIDGLLLPLMCDGAREELGSAQCEMCTRLIKQVLPKHTLETVLLGISRPASEAEGSRGGEGGREECVWTELTMPVVTAALNLKPPLSDVAIGTIVRRVEISSEAPELQKSLKFTTLVHSLVTRYGPQLKASLVGLETAIAKCSTFMVKAVLAALQRLGKK